MLDAVAMAVPLAASVFYIITRRLNRKFAANWMDYGNGLRGQVHDGNGDERVEVGYEADYGNMTVWSLEFRWLLKDLESLISNRLTLSGGLSLSQPVCLSVN